MLRRVLLVAISSTLVRAWLAHHYFGFETGDDVEIAQEAFRAAFGLAYEPWNLRNLFVSQALVAPFLAIARWAGLSDPFALAELARYPFLILGGVNVVLVYLLGREWFDERSGFLAAALYSIHWIPLVFGSSLYPRVPGTTFLLVAALLVTRRRFFAAGAAASLAFAARYSEIVFLAPLWLSVTIPAFSRTTEPFAEEEERPRGAGTRMLLGFGAGVLIFVGLYDWLSWGRPFSSLIEFARYTLVARQSSSLVKEQPVWWYVSALPQWLGPPLWPLLWRERKRALAFVVVPVIALSLVHHKELRYLQAVIPFAMILAAGAAMRWKRRRLVVVLLILALPLQLARIRSVEKRTMAAVDAARVLRGKRVAVSQAWAYGGALFLEPLELGIPPEPARLRALAPQADCAAMFRSQVTPELRRTLSEAGLTAARTFERARSRPVEVFCR